MPTCKCSFFFTHTNKCSSCAWPWSLNPTSPMVAAVPPTTTTPPAKAALQTDRATWAQTLSKQEARSLTAAHMVAPASLMMSVVRTPTAAQMVHRVVGAVGVVVAAVAGGVAVVAIMVVMLTVAVLLMLLMMSMAVVGAVGAVVAGVAVEVVGEGEEEVAGVLRRRKRACVVMR